MYYCEKEAQWMIESWSEKLYGESLRDGLISRGVSTIPAGMVMVYDICDKPHTMFQTLQTIQLDRMKNIHLIAYEMGSLVYMNPTVGKFIPTMRFGSCRIPTFSEFSKYRNEKTV